MRMRPILYIIGDKLRWIPPYATVNCRVYFIGGFVVVLDFVACPMRESPVSSLNGLGQSRPALILDVKMRLMTITKSDFLSHNPTRLGTFGGYDLFEHPTLGEGFPVIMTTPSDDVIETWFWDTADFSSDGIELCMEIDSDTEGTELNQNAELDFFAQSDSEGGL